MRPGGGPCAPRIGRLKALTPEVYYSISSEVCGFLDGHQRSGTLGLAAANGGKFMVTTLAEN